MKALRFDVVTLLPGLFAPFLSLGVIGRGNALGLLQTHFWNPRDYSPKGQVDDAPYGGGAGMVMCAEPLALAVEAARADALAEGRERPQTLFLDPTGERLTQQLVGEVCGADALVLVCGRYEGMDQRALDSLADRVVSLGDFVLSGGEVAAMALIEAVGRRHAGVLGNPDSTLDESFSGGEDAPLYTAPVYTRPRVWRGRQVPQELLSGDRERIRQWSLAAARQRQERQGQAGASGA